MKLNNPKPLKLRKADQSQEARKAVKAFFPTMHQTNKNHTHNHVSKLLERPTPKLYDFLTL